MATEDIQGKGVASEGESGGGKVAMFAIAIAVVLGAVFFGLHNTKIPKFGTSYGGCSVQNDQRTLTLQCPNDSALHSAINEFRTRHPDYDIVGLYLQKKK